MIWGQWNYNLDDGPNIGDYTQIETYHKYSRVLRTFEGIFAGWDENHIGHMIGQPRDDAADWMAIRWRRASLPELQEVRVGEVVSV